MGEQALMGPDRLARAARGRGTRSGVLAKAMTAIPSPAAPVARRASPRACRTALRTRDGACRTANTSSTRWGSSNSSPISTISRRRVRLGGRSTSSQTFCCLAFCFPSRPPPAWPASPGASACGRARAAGTRSGRRASSCRNRRRSPRNTAAGTEIAAGARWCRGCIRMRRQRARLPCMHVARCRLSQAAPECSHGSAARGPAEACTPVGRMSPSLRHAYNTPSMAGRAGMSAWGSCSAEQGSCGSARCTVSSERRVRVGVGGAVEGAPRVKREERLWGS
mmetsp:Transcript_34385/g.110978  ORF Transcript_34385/g.110978 Transcript_34385/m.110978 type:complete len:280 (-) Transcript_34385:538-1377(-)